MIRLIIKFLVFTFFILESVFSFTLTPLSQSIEFGKDSNTVIYQIENKNKEPIAVEISLKARNMKLDGLESLEDVGEDDFLLYPSQLILKASEKRGVKIQYLGNQAPASELSYRIIVEQLPIDFEKRKKTGVKLLLRYLGALYVTKSAFVPKVEIKEFKSIGDYFIFKVENSGDKHSVLKNLEITISEGKNKLVLRELELEGMSGENILAKKTREFKVKNQSKNSFSSKAKVQIKYE